MLKVARKWLVVLGVVVSAHLAGAVDLVNWNSLLVPVEFTAGSGSNTAMLVLDFAGTGNNVRYAFLYKWDGASTSFNMLNALDSASTSFSFTYNTTYGFAYVTGLSYNGYSLVDENIYESDALCMTSWWDGHDSYEDFTATVIPAESPSGAFSVAGLGVEGRYLADGYADGWTQNTVATWGTGQAEYPTAAPEPASIVLLSIAAIGVLRRNKKL